MEKVVVYGGHFNPIHSAHEMIISEVNDRINPDYFYIVPSYISPLKKASDPLNTKHRIKMVELVVENLGFGTVYLNEIERKGQSYTYDTMVDIKQKHPNAKLFFVIGTDQFKQLDQWYKIEALKALVTFIVVNRGETHTFKCNNMLAIEIPEMAISSTEIRKRRQNNQSIHMWVPLNVEQYITEEDLYG
ncbi:nicotinate (nicotinamide) nucleotide adenylyltransferase [Staphylococcus canis]|uniref:Probable nicotinate-nucleotide adenylyltransferase n=1 Tax=Staphylococcus canis TaxID=2724942 RepID=A0ABS0TBI4_9STAP|nr:nicotinate (nicotinamide) nucleotide adenylyltransferase [Staphylococcus canis]MBI5975772.1 nicotinate (nicotinamide) nucleotide adenylyltransferase [Staphylococcus canis]